jgi:two-component system, response regulator / RNA-binding antiterminator
MRILIADENMQRTRQLENKLRETGHEVIAFFGAGDMNAVVGRTNPDVVIIDIDSPDRDSLEQVAAIRHRYPRPMVLFTHGNDVEKLRAAVRAGVSAYIVEHADPGDIRAILEVAVAQFAEYHRIEHERDQARTQLADRKMIERAKGLLMQQRGCSEDEAYRALRKQAMDQETTVAEIAKSVVTVAGLLQARGN